MKNEKYFIEKITPKEKEYKVYINADSNDADYISIIHFFTQDEFDEIVDELINLKQNYGKNHQLRDYPNNYDLGIPYDGWDGCCHSLEDLEVTMIDTDGCVYNVNLI